MRKLLLVENSTCKIGQVDMSLIDTFLRLSEEIKNALGLPYHPIQFDSENRIRVERIIGNISLNDINLIIIPKVLQSNNSNSTEILKTFFLRTLKASHDRLNTTIYFTKNNIVDDQEILLDVLAKYYSESLSRAILLSNISTYETLTQKSSSVKGKILIQKQLSEPLSDAKLWCQYKKISTNNFYNALLVWACKFFTSSIRNVSIKRRLSQLVQEMGKQTSILTHQIVSGLHLPRQYAMYKESFTIAQSLFLRQSGKREEGIGNHLCGYVISTERAFEHIVEFYCRKAAFALGYGHRAQASIQLAQASMGNKYDYYIKPDDLVYIKDKRLVVDAKYKLLYSQGSYNKPVRDDIYQMICSCIAHKTYESVLVYPKVTGAIPITWKVNEKINGQTFIIRSSFADVFDTDEVLLKDMIKILQATTFYGENG